MSSGRLPTFLVIGAMKAGTTSLWQSLRAHPDVFMPERKEFHFFSNPERFERGVEWYREQFIDAGAASAVGEASTNYTKHPRCSGTPARIASVIPEVKLIYLVRDPISRIRSHYLHVVHTHGERRPLRVVIHEDPEYLDISRYRMQIDQYLDYFDVSQLLVVTAESFNRSRATIVGQVLEFVGVDPGRMPRSLSRNLNRSQEHRVDTTVSATARQIPGYKLWRRLTPAPVKRFASFVVQRPVRAVGDASIPVGLRRELEDELREDMAGLRPFLSPSFDGWGLLTSETK